MFTLSTGLQNVPSTGPGGVWASRTTLCPLKKNQQKTAVRYLQYRIHRNSLRPFVRALTEFRTAGAENFPTHLEFPTSKVSIDTIQSEMERRRPESPYGPRPPCRHAPDSERVLDESENSRRRVWHVASYGQYEATCPTRSLELSQGSRTRRDPKSAAWQLPGDCLFTL